MNTVFNREPFTPWKIVILDRYIDKTMEECEVQDYGAFDEFECFYRTTLKNSKQCEQFTMLVKDTDIVVLQLQVFKNGSISYFNEMPVFIEVQNKYKTIEIKPLVFCNVDKENRIITYEDIKE